MKILFDLLHPAHVHFFRNAIDILSAQGNKILVTARDKDVTLDLLEFYKIPYQCISKKKNGWSHALWELVYRTVRLFGIVKKFKPDVLVACTGVSTGLVGSVTRIPNLQFYDTEAAGWQNRISYPLATKIYTPRAYKKDISKRHERYAGYHELAYLHPKYFSYDRKISEKLASGEKYCLLRFVSFQAAHDRGVAGLSLRNKIKAVKEFEKYARVFISAEGKLPEELEKYKLNIRSGDIHHVVAGASLVFGESATMASEASVLGVPAIFVYGYSLGYLQEQEEEYQTVFSFSSQEDSQAEAIALG